MKTVEMFQDYDYRAHPRRTVRFLAGVTYAHVIESAVREIVDAGAGRIVTSHAVGTYLTRDASAAFRPKRENGK